MMTEHPSESQWCHSSLIKTHLLLIYIADFLTSLPFIVFLIALLKCALFEKHIFECCEKCNINKMNDFHYY